MVALDIVFYIIDDDLWWTKSRNNSQAWQRKGRKGFTFLYLKYMPHADTVTQMHVLSEDIRACQVKI